MLETLIQGWGLPTLFAGGLVEGDAVAMLGGALAHRGHLGFAATSLAVGAGAAVADQAWFFLARRHRQAPFIRRIAGRPATTRILAMVARRPVPAIIGFRFVWGMRTMGPVALGLSAVPARLYVPLNLLSVALWALMMTALGYGAGQRLQAMFGRLPLWHHLGLLLVGCAAVGLIVHAIRRRRN